MAKVRRHYDTPRLSCAHARHSCSNSTQLKGGMESRKPTVMLIILLSVDILQNLQRLPVPCSATLS